MTDLRLTSDAPKAASPFAKRPNTTNEIRGIVTRARDAEMPDYTADPALWERAARGRMANILRSLGIKANYRITVMLNDVFSELEESEQGDFQALRKHLILDLRAKRNRERVGVAAQKAQTAAKDEITAYAKAAGMTPSQVDHTVREYINSARRAEHMTVDDAKHLVDKEIAKQERMKKAADPFFGTPITAEMQAETIARVNAATAKPMPVSDIIREAFPESVAAMESKEAAKSDWSFVTETDPDEQERKALGHFLRELKVTNKTITYSNIGFHVVTALGKSLGLSIIENGAEATRDALQLYIDNYNVKTAPKTPEIETAPIPTPVTPKESEIAPMDTPENVKQTEIVSLPESPFSANFKLIDKHGIEVQFTIRAESGAVGVPKVDSAIEYLLTHEYTTNRTAPAATHSNGNGATAQPTQQSEAGGVATCVLISVGESYQGGKTQLNFDCDGMEFPLKFTKPDQMVKLLRNVKKSNGEPFTQADLTNGRKFPGQWNVKWSQKDKYRDVVSVDAA